MNPIKLTPDQIQHIDVISRDREAYNQTLKIAITHAANMISELDKRKKDWWEGVYKTYNLDPTCIYGVKLVNGYVSIVLKDDE